MTAEIIDDAPQADGRRYIRERHVAYGVTQEFVYLGDAETNAEAVMAARAVDLPNQVLSQYEDREAGNGVFA